MNLQQSQMTRRQLLASTAAASVLRGANTNSRPNVIVVLTDDQGYGDLSCHGNPILKTPNIDRLYRESVRLTQFHSAPMCTPTRSQLMTGVDCLRNGAMATACGRSQVREGLTTLPQVFSNAGYATGLFGKWHLGYSYPHRPMDRGFGEANYFLGYGITGAGDFWNNDYFNPRYYRNGRPAKAVGYCTDVWFDLAMKWMDQCRSQKQPFFCYVPTNAPHFPEWVSAQYAQRYTEKGPAAYFGMVANLDDNVGRLETFLRKTGLRDNTILIFMTDNGGVTGVKLFNAGMRGGKTSLYDGGHRVPCFVRWPKGNLEHGRNVSTQAQVQDIMPTLMDLCGIPRLESASLDGVSLAQVLRGRTIPDRMFVVQYYQNSLRKNDSTVVWNQWRLVKTTELYDIAKDPAQQTNVIAENPEIAARMRDHYERWWTGIEPRLDQLVASRIGSDVEATTLLCCSEWQDVRCDGQPSVRNAAGGPRGGPWNVIVERAGSYSIELRRWPADADTPLRAGLPEFRAAEGTLPPGKALPIAAAHLWVAGQKFDCATEVNDKAAAFRVNLPRGRTQLHGWFGDKEGQAVCGAYFAYVTDGD